MLTEFRTLSAEDTLERAVAHVLAGSQQDFPVLDAGRVVGILTRADLISALSKMERTRPVAEAMRSRFGQTSPDELLEVALLRMSQEQVHVLPVLEGSRLAGMLTSENVGEFLAIGSAIESRGHARNAPATRAARTPTLDELTPK